MREATGAMIEVAFVDQGYTGAQPAEASHAHGIRLEVVKLPTTKCGFVLRSTTQRRGAQLRLDDPFSASGS